MEKIDCKKVFIENMRQNGIYGNFANLVDDGLMAKLYNKKVSWENIRCDIIKALEWAERNEKFLPPYTCLYGIRNCFETADDIYNSRLLPVQQ